MGLGEVYIGRQGRAMCCCRSLLRHFGQSLGVVLEDDKWLGAKAVFRSGRDLCSPDEQAWRNGEATKGGRDLRFRLPVGSRALGDERNLEGEEKGAREKVSAPWRIL